MITIISCILAAFMVLAALLGVLVLIVGSVITAAGWIAGLLVAAMDSIIWAIAMWYVVKWLLKVLKQ